MKRCKTHLVHPVIFLIFLLVTVPGFAQRGSFDVNAGEAQDKFDTLGNANSVVLDINGEVTVKKPSAKHGGPSIVAGGEIRVPGDTNNHSKEYAVYGGLAFQARSDLSFGFDAQIRKIYLPSANVDNQFFVRGIFEFLEIPLVVKYNFGPDHRAFIHLKGAPEFTPRFHAPSSTLTAVSLPGPNFDHAYFVRGSLGYTFGKLYVQGTYETRFFKFERNPNNPSNLYNWKSNMITAGVGVNF